LQKRSLIVAASGRRKERLLPAAPPGKLLVNLSELPVAFPAFVPDADYEFRIRSWRRGTEVLLVNPAIPIYLRPLP
jgi:hypothetical protein